MEENNNYLNEEAEEVELSHMDKMVGIFTDPGETFKAIASAPAKITDWLFPLIIVVALSIGTQFLVMSNPVLKMKAIEKQMGAIEEQFQKAIDEGQMSQEQVDAQLEQIRGQMEQNMSAGLVMNSVIGVIAGFLIFFLIASIFFGIFKVAYKSPMDYGHALVAFGLPGYITILEVVAMVVYMFATDNIVDGANVAAFMGMEKTTFVAFLLAKAAPIKIWAFAVTGIGMAKISNDDNSMKYILMMLGVWFGWGVIMYFLSSMVPFLRYFI